MAKYIYICSAGHSGSTLLDLLLGSHSRIESLGEISFLSHDIAVDNRCTCGSPVRECHIWRSVVKQLSSRFGVDILAHPYALHIDHPKAVDLIDNKHQTHAYLARRKLLLGLHYLRLRFGVRFLDPMLRSVRTTFATNMLIYETVREVLDVDMVVDSSKSYLKALGVYLSNPAEVRIILLMRDGRGVLWSSLKRKWSRNKSVIAWTKLYERALPLLERYVHAEHLLRVRYEALATDPVREASRICSFLQVEFEPAMLNFATVPHHSINGNNMRFMRSSQIRMDTEWRDRLSPEDLRYFERRAGRLNRRLGYS
jgi:Sulfotransferase family